MEGEVPRGKVEIELDRPSYVAGETVRGFVYVTLTEPFHVDKLLLRIYGSEKVRYHWNDSDGNRRNGAKSEPISSVDWIPLAESNAWLDPGTHSFPFEMVLPTTTPATVKAGSFFTRGRVDTCSIEHRVEALLANVNRGSLLNRDEGSTPLLVREPTPIAYSTRNTTTRKIKLLCCLAKGTCKVTTTLDKNIFVAGETAQIECEVRNDSFVEIRAMRAYLIRNIDLHFGGPTNPGFEVAVANFAGLAPQSSTQQTMSLPLVDAGGAYLCPSTHGKLFKCEYTIRVEADVPWCPDVRVNLPVTILDPSVPSAEYEPPTKLVTLAADLA